MYKSVNKIQYKKMKTLLVYNYFLCRLSQTKINKSLKNYTTTVRVRYAETDQMGVVYHGNYAQYFEEGRTEWLRHIGVTYKSLEEKEIILPVISIGFKFIKSALYDDLLTIKTILKKTPKVKIEFYYEITNQNNELICTGSSILAFINRKTKKPIACPKYILEKLGL